MLVSPALQRGVNKPINNGQSRRDDANTSRPEQASPGAHLRIRIHITATNRSESHL